MDKELYPFIPPYNNVPVSFTKRTTGCYFKKLKKKLYLMKHKSSHIPTDIYRKRKVRSKAKENDLLVTSVSTVWNLHKTEKLPKISLLLHAVINQFIGKKQTFFSQESIFLQHENWKHAMTTCFFIARHKR